MSLLARSSLRVVPRLVRPLATTASEYFVKLNALREHAARMHRILFSIFSPLIRVPPADTTDLWRKISFYVAFPATFVTCAWVYNVESEHASHEDPLIEENNGTLPQPPAYPYLNRRVKPFPWGSNSLFFNPRYNKDMSQVDE
ncbi:COX6A, subunit VIa of cytochrome c oxidase [Chiua virens]|nr:COX6A, subunit VIa of cytochrome c oxidase [Chiua virens]